MLGQTAAETWAMNMRAALKRNPQHFSKSFNPRAAMENSIQPGTTKATCAKQGSFHALSKTILAKI